MRQPLKSSDDVCAAVRVATSRASGRSRRPRRGGLRSAPGGGSSDEYAIADPLASLVLRAVA